MNVVNTLSPNRNRHLVDRYCDLKEEIKILEEKASKLREEIIESLPRQPSRGENVEVEGDDYLVTALWVESERLDRKMVEALLSKPKFQSCLKASQSITIRTAKK